MDVVPSGIIISVVSSSLSFKYKWIFILLNFLFQDMVRKLSSVPTYFIEAFGHR